MWQNKGGVACIGEIVCMGSNGALQYRQSSNMGVTNFSKVQAGRAKRARASIDKGNSMGKGKSMSKSGWQ